LQCAFGARTFGNVTRTEFASLDPVVSRAAVAFMRSTGREPSAGCRREVDGRSYVLITGDGTGEVYRLTPSGALKRLRRPPVQLAEDLEGAA